MRMKSAIRKWMYLKAICPVSEEQVWDIAVRGQYGAGSMEGQKVLAYRSEPGIDDLPAETFAAIYDC